MTIERGIHVRGGMGAQQITPISLMQVQSESRPVIPLILLSAYLILWKPRKRKAESDA